jgi:hypothetical protein
MEDNGIDAFAVAPTFQPERRSSFFGRPAGLSGVALKTSNALETKRRNNWSYIYLWQRRTIATCSCSKARLWSSAINNGRHRRRTFFARPLFGQNERTLGRVVVVVVEGIISRPTVRRRLGVFTANEQDWDLWAARQDESRPRGCRNVIRFHHSKPVCASQICGCQLSSRRGIYRAQQQYGR